MLFFVCQIVNNRAGCCVTQPNVPVTPEAELKEHLSPGVQDQPGHRYIPLGRLVHVPLIPALQEAGQVDLLV